MTQLVTEPGVFRVQAPPHRMIESALPRNVAILALSIVILRPVSNNAVLLPLLATLGGLGLWGMVARRSSRLPGDLALAFAIVTWVGLTFSALGAWHGAPGWPYGLITWVGGPLIFFCVASCVEAPDLLRFFRILPYLTLYISCGLILSVGLHKGLSVPSPIVRFFTLLDQGSAVNAQAGFVETRYYAISSLIGLVPIMVVLLVSPKAKGALPGRILVGAATATGLFAALLSGRRALQVVSILAPFVAFSVVRGWGRSRTRTWVLARAVVAGTAMLVLLYLGIRAFTLAPTAYGKSFAGGGVQQGDYSLLSEEATHLLEAGLQSPLIGRGIGATIRGYARDELRPWNFELQYPLVFFQTGLVGVGAIFGAAFLAVRQHRRSVIDTDLAFRTLHTAALACAIAIVVADASNPYLQAVGHHWMLFLPAAVIGAQHRRGVAAGAPTVGATVPTE